LHTLKQNCEKRCKEAIIGSVEGHTILYVTLFRPGCFLLPKNGDLASPLFDRTARYLLSIGSTLLLVYGQVSHLEILFFSWRFAPLLPPRVATFLSAYGTISETELFIALFFIAGELGVVVLK